jgi:putative DNA primase/helicase
MAAAAKCFCNWLQGRGGEGAQEEQAMLSQVRQFFERHGESRFTPWDAVNDYKSINRAGFRLKNDEGEEELLVFPGVFKSEISAGFDTTAVNSRHSSRKMEIISSRFCLELS